ncbi:hypothetical protein NZK35_20460 [Stieleria sp. ICT_E10.1]|uniref:hypothetical protein n=1 Tax=Stieleria sedimenti TaxID=2976331 RepID=UPI00217F388C|nr:hypothetical protein [Stieleria sedimenti]MCS7469032.1 hypothetical protein [Stieleria sedimenti]
MSMHLVDHGGVTDHGTLLWIGDRDSNAYCDAYDFCESHVSQLAYRADLKSALLRPASAVRTILCCRDNDSAESIELFRTLCRLHGDAKAVLLLGPLCAGARPSPADLFDVPTIHWHQWESFLPGYLRRCGWANPPSAAPQSIAVVASSYANASALLSIASSGPASAIWCRPDQLATLHRFDEIWWDDSATQGQPWDRLMDRLVDPPREHVWVSGNITPKAKSAAMEAGVDLVIAKPGDFSLLIDRASGASGLTQRRAA